MSLADATLVGSDLSVAQLLRFEAANPGASGSKGLRIMDELKVPPARYYQLLGRAIQTREALEFDAVLTNRLLARQLRRAEERARRLGEW